MITSTEIINIIKSFSLTERLMIVEEILRIIREENAAKLEPKPYRDENTEPAILSLAGILNEEEANVMMSAVEESRKIDDDEW